MDINGRITQVEFKPDDYFLIKGMANSSFNESRCYTECGFNMKWFWFDSMPPDVLAAFTELIALVDEKLQWQGILPKKWPGVLDNSEPDADIFKFHVTKYTIFNPMWASSRERDDSVIVAASSEWFTDGKGIEKEINLRFKDDELTLFFKTLDLFL